MVNVKNSAKLIVLAIVLTWCQSQHIAEAQESGTANQPADPTPRQASIQVPDSVKAMVEEAGKAISQKDWAKAEQTLAQILTQEPGLTLFRFDYANVLARAGKPNDAIRELDKAIGPKPTFDDLVNAGAILQGSSKNPGPSYPSMAQAYFQRALDLAVRRGGLKSAGVERLKNVADLALRLQQTPTFDNATDEIIARFPESKEAYYYRGMRSAMKQDWLTASDELAKARALGVPTSRLDNATLDHINNLAKPRRYAWRMVYTVCAVAGGLVVLLFLGRLLSFLTLRSAKTADPNMAITPMERFLRRVYRLVINLAGIYYYVCLPFVFLIAIGIVIGAGYLLLMLGRIPVKAIVILFAFGCAMLAMIWSSIRSLFVRIKYEDPGRALTEEEAPKLWELTREVASAIGTRPVNAIFLTPGTEVAVFERGNWLQKLRDQSRRSLILGQGVIKNFLVDDFRAVLAHEYGHFLHRDTAGGDVAMRLNATMGNFATAMANRGQLAWWNIGWQFVRLYHFIFRRITHGASRLQEINADRVAAILCGKKAFEGGLRHVIRCDIVQNITLGRMASRMDRIAGVAAWAPKGDEDCVASMVQLFDENRGSQKDPWWEIYNQAENRQQGDQALAEAWNAIPSEDDTHPSPVERVRLLSRLALPEPPQAGQATGVQGLCKRMFLESLFKDPEALHTERAKELTQVVATHVAVNRLTNLNTVQQINAYLTEHPGLSEPLQQRAQMHYTLCHFAEAEADCNELIALDGPNLGMAYYLRGLARAMLNKNDDAIADFREALSHTPNMALTFRTELGDAHMQAGRPQEAIEEYTQAIAISPDKLQLYLRRASAYTRATQYPEAEADFAKALELAPGCAEALALRALERAQAGHREEAETDAKAALTIDPSIIDVLPEMASLMAYVSS